MHYKGLLFSAILLTVTALSASSQEKATVNLGILARIDYQREYQDGTSFDSGCGFRGKNVSVLANGTFGGHFSYKYRQRLYREHGTESFFNATDHLFLTYTLNDRWSFSAGKQTVLVGGFDYDLAPFDVYFISEYSNSISCYRFAVNAFLRLQRREGQADGAVLPESRSRRRERPLCLQSDVDRQPRTLQHALVRQSS